MPARKCWHNWSAVSVVSLLAVDPYHRTTYQILSPLLTCLMVISLVYSGVALPRPAFPALTISNFHCADFVL